MKFRFFIYALAALSFHNSKAQCIIPNSPVFTMFTVNGITDSGAVLNGAIVNFSTHIGTLTQNIINYNAVYNPAIGLVYPNIKLGYNFKIVPTVTLSSVQTGGQKAYTGDTIRISILNFGKDTLKFRIKMNGLEPNVAYCSNYNLQGFYIFGVDTATNNRLNSYASSLYYQSFSQTAYNYNNPPPKLPLGYSSSFSQSLGNYGYPPQVIFTTSVSANPRPKPVVPTIIYSAPPPHYIYPQVYGSDTLGVDSVFDLRNSGVKIAFHFKFTDFTKRLNFNLSGGKSFTLVPIAHCYPGATASGNTITINASNFNANGTRISFVVSLDYPSPTIGNVASIFYGVNVYSDSKEGVFAYYQTTSNLLGVYPANPDYTVTMPAGKIQGNILPFVNKIVCKEPSANGDVYNPGIISAPAPTGGFGSYTYLWQKRIGWGVWENCPSFGNGNEDYMIASFNASVLKSPEEYYRRVVTSRSSESKVSGVYFDTSNVFKVIYLSDTILPTVTIEQVGVAGNAPIMRIVTNHESSVLHYNITDINSKNEPVSHTQYGNYFTIPNTNNAYEHSYNISVKHSGTCPLSRAKEIFVSKPDGNGNIYPAIKIRKQYWMIANLRATRFNDGTPLTGLTNTLTQTKAEYLWYNNDSLLNASSNGALYNVTVINNDAEKNVCPVNWRVAGFADWDLLVQKTGGYPLSGNSLKLPMAWSGLNPLKQSINFNARPSGEYAPTGNGFDYNFVGKGEVATWWGIIADLKVDPPKFNANYFEVTNGGKAITLTTAGYSIGNDKIKRSIRCVTNAIK